MRILRRFWLLILFWASANSAFAFALLGPFAPWMTAQLSYQDGFSIGGPMDIGQGYRWNVPIVTYGYDPSFIDYFGTNGVAAVEAAIQILNEVPPASSVVLTNYPLYTRRINYRALTRDLSDLKSAALGMLVEQMGLASPSRFVFCLRGFTDPTEYTLIERNFDPLTWAPSVYVNGLLYWYHVYYYPNYTLVGTVPFVVDVQQNFEAFSAVADFLGIQSGEFYTGLSRDDIGGFSYLLGTNNLAPEPLLPGITGWGRNARHYVTTAVRPGVDKVTLRRLEYDQRAGKFYHFTYRYVDSYLTNDIIEHQLLKRVVTEPDILFTARYEGLMDWSRTGTANWVNMGAPSNAGPGVIQPPVEINFNCLGPSVFNGDSLYPDTNIYPAVHLWGSFDGTTNPPVVFPLGSITTNNTEFHLWLLPIDLYYPVTAGQGFHWNLQGQPGVVFSLETSVDLTNWVNVTTFTNLGGTFTYAEYIQPDTPQRFFRTVPQ